MLMTEMRRIRSKIRLKKFRATLALLPLFVREDSKILTETEEHVQVVEKGGLVRLNREFDYSDVFWPNPGVAELGGLLDRDKTLDVSNINDNFSDKVNKILGPPSTPDLINDKITIIEYKHHAGSLQYLVHDA